MATFYFTNTSSGSVYFTYETVRNTNGIYDSTSLKAASATFSGSSPFFTGVTEINEDHIVKSDYIWSAVIPEGASFVEFNPENTVPIGSVYFRGTGNLTVKNMLGESSIQTLTPSELHGQGTLNSIETPFSTTTVERSKAFYYRFDPGNAISNWNTIINATSSLGSGGDLFFGSSQQSARGSAGYGNSRLMVQYDLSGISGTITSITIPFTTNISSTSTVFDAKIFGAGTASLGGGNGEYSYYKDEGSTAFSSPLAITGSTSYSPSLNAAALTIANTKPTNFVIAVISEFDYTATPPASPSIHNSTINISLSPAFPLIIRTSS